MAVSTTTPTPSAALLNSVNTRSNATSSTDADQDKFMTLLITQLQNQDPLNPLDNAEVTSQLAQLNTVTGINKLNETMNTYVGYYVQNNQAVGMIDKGVLVAGKKLELDESGSIKLGVELGTTAESVTVDIKDKNGNVVKTFTQGATEPSIVPLEWDGKLDDGSRAPAGEYTVAVSAKSAGADVDAIQALQYGKVSSVSTGAYGTRLDVPPFGAIALGDIKQVF